MSAQPPKAPKKPHPLEIHNDTRIDDYYWLRDRENQEVIDYLNAENAYTEATLAPVKAFREMLFEEMKGRIKEQDESVPSILFRFGLSTGTPIKGSDSKKSQVEGTRSFRDWAEQLRSPMGPQPIAFPTNAAPFHWHRSR